MQRIGDVYCLLMNFITRYFTIFKTSKNEESSLYPVKEY